jgi:hypothetical protein
MQTLADTNNLSLIRCTVHLLESWHFTLTSWRRRLPARLMPHSAVYAASALPMKLPQNIHGQSALKVRNDIHKFKKILLHKCHTESTVAALKWIILCNTVACPNFLVWNLPQQLRHKCGVARHKCGVMRHSVEWCGVAWNAAFPRNVQSFAALCGLFAYSADLRHMPWC